MFLEGIIFITACLMSYQLGKMVQRTAYRKYSHYWLARYLELLGNEQFTEQDAQELRKGDSYV